MSDDWFSDFGGQAPRSGGNYFAPGVYIVRLEATVRRMSENPQTRGHQLFVGELTIHEILTQYEADPDGWAASNRVGERVAYVQNTTKHGDTAFSNIKGLLLAALQVGSPAFKDQDKSVQEWRQALLAVTQPPGKKLAGIYLRARVTKTRTKAGKPFTPVAFEPIEQAPYLAPASPTEATPAPAA